VEDGTMVGTVRYSEIWMNGLRTTDFSTRIYLRPRFRCYHPSFRVDIPTLTPSQVDTLTFIDCTPFGLGSNSHEMSILPPTLVSTQTILLVCCIPSSINLLQMQIRCSISRKIKESKGKLKSSVVTKTRERATLHRRFDIGSRDIKLDMNPGQTLANPP